MNLIQMRLVFLSLALMVSSSSSADTRYQQCIDRTSTNFDWSACGGDYLKRLDFALNKSWRKALTSLDSKQVRAQLLAEQRAWIRFKDSSCEYYANGEFGREGQVLDFPQCRAQIVEARIKDLDDLTAFTHQNQH